MKTINIYALTRTLQTNCVRRYDKQISGRDYYLPVKDWEIEGLRKLADLLCLEPSDYDRLHFFYSFQIPKLGKEFDLLQIAQDCVLNIELKSQPVPDEKIRKQLLLNRSYLATLEKDVYSFTYVSSQNRLLRLTHSGRLSEADPELLRRVLQPSSQCVTCNVEELFGEEKYLISPLTDPDRFLRRDYFLTSQQRDIRSKMIRNIAEHSDRDTIPVQGFTGLPGTGKTLLLYDLAMYFSEKQKVCILHSGTFTEEMKRLDALLKRIDFVDCERLFQNNGGYSLLCVDEAHRIPAEMWKKVYDYALSRHIPVIISCDDETMISPHEREQSTEDILETLPGYIRYSLTNRIRTNTRLSAFIRSVVHLTRNSTRKDCPEIQVFYASSHHDTELYLQHFQEKGYVHIPSCAGNSPKEAAMDSELFSREFSHVVMTAGPDLYYDEQGYLREHTGTGAIQPDNAAETPSQNLGRQQVSRLFHGLNRAKKGLALIIEENEPLFEKILTILQGDE